MNDAPKPFSTTSLQGGTSEPTADCASAGQASMTLSTRRRMLLQAGAIAGALGPACLNATSILPPYVPATLEQKLAGTSGFILIGTFTGVVKSLQFTPIHKAALSPGAIAALKKKNESTPRTQEALDAYKRDYPVDPALFVSQDGDKLGLDRFDLLEFKLEEVAFVRGKNSQHMDMDAKYIYFYGDAREPYWSQVWKPFLNRRVIVLSEGEGTLPNGIPTPFALHRFTTTNNRVNDDTPIPISDLPKVSEIALRLNFYRPGNRK